MLLSVPIRPRIPHRYTVDGCGCETEYVWINVWTWIRHISVIVVLCRKLSIKSGENEKNTYYSYTPTGGTRKHIFRKFLPWIIYVLWCCQAHCQESGPYRNSDSGLKIGVSFSVTRATWTVFENDTPISIQIKSLRDQHIQHKALQMPWDTTRVQDTTCISDRLTEVL